MRDLSSLSIYDSTIQHNFVYGYGGAGYIEASVVDSERNTYYNNSAYGCGGAIRLQMASSLYDEDTLYLENKSSIIKFKKNYM